MKIRSAVPENGCLVFFDGRKKHKTKKIQKKKQKKTSVKHIRIRLIGGCVNKPTGYATHWSTYTVSQKKEATKLRAVTLSNLNRF